MESYYEKLLESGVKLSSCVMSHNAYWSYFMGLQERYPDVCINTFGGSISYLNSAIRNYPNDYCYDKYDLFLLASSDLFDEDHLEKLEKIAIKMSENNKRITVGYSYIVENQGCSSYNLKSYLNGIKDFKKEGQLERYAIDSIQMIDLMAEVHMKLNNKIDNEETLKLGLDLNK